MKTVPTPHSKLLVWLRPVLSLSAMSCTQLSTCSACSPQGYPSCLCPLASCFCHGGMQALAATVLPANTCSSSHNMHFPCSQLLTPLWHWHSANFGNPRHLPIGIFDRLLWADHTAAVGSCQLGTGASWRGGMDAGTAASSISQQLHMNSMKLVIPLHFISRKKDSKRCCDTTMPESIHTKDESKLQFSACFHLWCELTTTINVTE